MVQNLSQTGNISSPSANMLSFSTPSGLGIEGITPAGLNIPTPALAGTAMVPTMSDLGLTASGRKRNEDEERRVKMRKVLRSIGKPKGRVSEEGIARVSRRVGFANDIDAEKLTPEERERKVGNRPISTAGNTIVIEVDIKNHVPHNVQVMYSVQSKALDEQGAKASRVLLDDLKAPDGISLKAKLDRFALNLERLAKLDRLSSHGLNCFEALIGVYSSLRRLHEQELVATRGLLDPTGPNSDDKADVEVTCKKSGKPTVHARGRLGLELVYWRESEHFGRENNSKPDSSAMDVDEPGSYEDNVTDEGHIFSLRIEAEASPAGIYPSLRASDLWLPDPLKLPAAESGEGVPWQDPPPTIIVANGGGDAMAVDSQQKLPDLRFIAKLNPPLVMPYQTAMNVLSTVGVPTPPVLTIPPQYAALLLDPSSATQRQPQTVSYSTTALQAVLSQRNGQETTVSHRYILNNVKLDWGFKIEELPFSHPRQLVELLPTLRQWARVGGLLKAALRSHAPSQVEQSALNGATHIDRMTNGHSRLDDLLHQADTAPADPNIPVNIALATAPTPTLGVIFPTLGGDRIANISVQVLPNADIAVTNHEGLKATENGDKAQEAQTLAKALDVCGDLGVWVEWIRTRSNP